LVDVDGGSNSHATGTGVDQLADMFAATASTIDFIGGDENLTIENEKTIFK
jgi:hypothetical protein